MQKWYLYNDTNILNIHKYHYHTYIVYLYVIPCKKLLQKPFLVNKSRMNIAIFWVCSNVEADPHVYRPENFQGR